MVRSTVAHVDLSALQANFRAIDAYLASRTPPAHRAPEVIAVVKANAYGHGARHVALALERAGAATLAGGRSARAGAATRMSASRCLP